MTDAPTALDGIRVVTLESRRAAELEQLLARHGATVIRAPALREIPLEENPHAIELVERLERGTIDVVILLTGVGTRALVEAVRPRCPTEKLVELLRRVTIVARGPKPVAALRSLDLVPQVRVPEPNTWRELLAALDAAGAIAGKRVVVQEYGVGNPELLAGLRERGAVVTPVAVYRWALPTDLEPLREAIRRVAAGSADVALFTSATQIAHVLEVAETMGLRDAAVAGLADAVVGSIGPVCTAALREAGITVDCEPSHPKMGVLATETLRSTPALRAARAGVR